MRTSRQLITEVKTAVNQNGVAALVVRFGDGDQYLFTEHEELPVARLEDMRATGGRPIAIAVARKRDARIEGWLQFERSSTGRIAEFFGVMESQDHVANECRIAFWATSVGEVDELAQVIVRAGGRNIEGPAHESSDYYAVSFEDPCGNRFEVCHRI